METTETQHQTPAATRTECSVILWLRESADRHEADGRPVSALLRRNEAAWMESLDMAAAAAVPVEKRGIRQ